MRRSEISSIAEGGLFLALEFTLAFTIRLFGGNMMENVIYVAAFTAVYMYRNPFRNCMLYVLGQAVLALTFGFGTLAIVFTTIPAAMIGVLIGLSFRKNKLAIGILIGLALSVGVRAMNIFVYDNYILGISYTNLVEGSAEIAETFVKIVKPAETFDNIYRVSYIVYFVSAFIVFPVVEVAAIILVLNWADKKIIKRIRRV